MKNLVIRPYESKIWQALLGLLMQTHENLVAAGRSAMVWHECRVDAAYGHFGLGELGLIKADGIVNVGGPVGKQ
jgi:hypothetical protein